MGEAKRRGSLEQRILQARAGGAGIRKLRPEAQVGIAPDNRFCAVAGDGSPRDPAHAIFPILRQHSDKKTHDFVGTGFFVAKCGIFVTARHVLKMVQDDDPRGPFALGIIQLLADGTYVERPVRKIIWSNSADIGIGVCAEMKSPSTDQVLDNPILRMTTRDPSVEEPVFTFAYPDTVVEQHANSTALHTNPHFYEGKIEEHFPERRDSSLLTWPCFQTNMHLHGGASGGPVFDSTGAVFGINTSSMAPWTDVSYVSKIREALGLKIDEIIIEPSSEAGEYFLYEIARMGFASLIE
jgi:hypothetical protein